MSPSQHLAAVPDRSPAALVDPVAVVIAEDHALMRGSLRAVLEGTPGIAVAGEAGSLALARRQVIGHRPAVLVLDLQMPDGSSIQTVGELRKRVPGTRVVIVSMEDAPGFAQRVLAVGASGYVLKELAADDLPAAVLAAAAGEQFLSAPIASRLSRSRQALTDGRLTTRQTEVLRLIALGYTTGEITEQLSLSPRTIETHRAHIHRKLELRTRAELVGHALRCGLMAT